MTGDVYPLCPVPQRQTEAAAFPACTLIGALQPEQVGQPHAEASAIAAGALSVAGPGKGVRLGQALQSTGHFYRHLSGWVALDVLVKTSIDDSVVYAV